MYRLDVPEHSKQPKIGIVVRLWPSEECYLVSNNTGKKLYTPANTYATFHFDSVWDDHKSRWTRRPVLRAAAAGAPADYVPPECEANVQPGNPDPYHECPECHEHSCRWESGLSRIRFFSALKPEGSAVGELLHWLRTYKGFYTCSVGLFHCFFRIGLHQRFGIEVVVSLGCWI